MNEEQIVSIDNSTFDLKVLNKAFLSFNTTAHHLQQSYRRLYDQVKRLNSELEEKNRQLEKNLREKEEVKNFLYTILESLPTGVFVTDMEGRLRLSNKAVEKILGSDPASMDAEDFLLWFDKLLPSEVRAHANSPASAHDVECSSNDDGLRYLKILQSPVMTAYGAPTGRVYILQDQTRLKRLEMQSERDKRLKAMGEMAIRIAHEVRNPLGSIELLASILRSELAGQSDLKKISDRIITEVKGLDNTISNLLLFTRPQQPHLHVLDVQPLMNEFVDFIRPIVMKNGVELHYNDAVTPFMISGDRDLLKQVFLNLTLNAMQALPDGGSISIEVRRYSDSEEPHGNWVEISFRDNGIGIDGELLNKIFNPFYTTKEKGTGLGLSIVHNIIESHHGIIDVRSRTGEGTTFVISIPAWSPMPDNPHLQA